MHLCSQLSFQTYPMHSHRVELLLAPLQATDPGGIVTMVATSGRSFTRQIKTEDIALQETNPATPGQLVLGNWSIALKCCTMPCFVAQLLHKSPCTYPITQTWFNIQCSFVYKHIVVRVLILMCIFYAFTCSVWIQVLFESNICTYVRMCLIYNVVLCIKIQSCVYWFSCVSFMPLHVTWAWHTCILKYKLKVGGKWWHC